MSFSTRRTSVFGAAVAGLAPLAVAGGLALSATTAVADPPPGPSVVPSPPPGSQLKPADMSADSDAAPLRVERSAATLRVVSVQGRTLTVALRCRTPGRLSVSAGGVRSAAARFGCRAGSAQPTLTMPRALARRLQSRSSLPAVFIVEARGRSTQFPTVLRAKPSSSTGRYYGYFSRAYCQYSGNAYYGGGSVTFSVDYRDGFGAAVGDRVDWLVWLYWFDHTTGQQGWYTDQPRWLSYTRAGQFGQALGSADVPVVGGNGGSIGISGSHSIAVRRNVTVWPAIETQTYWGGRRLTWLTTIIASPAWRNEGGCYLP